ncbi:uncharacterized protein LOC141618559 [Silene latifolia]|uniref:uncharacterized protein LOC141618559 n=1 Tax=Silene latifolia TaxID=37657 RepID=UPI003D77553E
MKEILTRKRSFNKAEKVAFTQKCIAVMQANSPPKLKHLGSFSIPSHIGHLAISKALCELVADDVLVRVGKFFIPVDFVVLDMVEDTQIPIILGRPFFHTPGAVIDVRKGRLALGVGDDTIIFNLEKALKHPMIEETCHSIDVVDMNIDECLALCLNKDHLEIALLSDSAAETGS